MTDSLRKGDICNRRSLKEEAHQQVKDTGCLPPQPSKRNYATDTMNLEGLLRRLRGSRAYCQACQLEFST